MSTEPGAPPAGGPVEFVVGIDVGTTAAKVVAFGLGSPLRYAAVREYPLLQPHPGWQVQDAHTVARALLDALAECVLGLAAPVIAVSVSTAMHGLIGLGPDGEPLTPLLTWADARSRDQSRRLRDSGSALEVYRRSGTPVHPMMPLTKLMWFAQNQPEMMARARWWAGLKDFVLGVLTGRVVTELSSASGTGMLDLGTRDWAPSGVEMAGVRRDQLPEVVPTTTTLPLLPAVARRTGLPSGLPVVVGAGDGPLGNLGTGATRPGVVGLSLGTSGAARMMVGSPRLDPDGRLFCYALTGDRWVVGGAVSNGGVVVRWAGDVFGQHASDAAAPRDAELLALAEHIPAGSDGLVMLPYLLAERGPLWDPDLAGAYLGIRHAHTRAHFIRAAVEGVALQLSTIVDSLDRLEPVTAVRATGGAFRSPVWRRIMAAVIGRPMTVTAGAEGTALGAAALGLYAIGRCPDLESAVSLLESNSEPGQDGATIADVFEPTDPIEVTAYIRVRSSIPTLLSGYDEVARLFESLTPASA